MRQRRNGAGCQPGCTATVDIVRYNWNPGNQNTGSVVATGWLDPGEYRFEASGYAAALAGTRHRERLPSEEGTVEHSADFRLLEGQPEEP